MFWDVTYPDPVGSFRYPVTVPGVEPDAGVLVYVAFSEAWQPYIVGCLKQLLLQSTWGTDDPDVLNVTQLQAFKLIDQFKGGALATGAIMAYAGSTVPDGWLLCDGSAVSRTDHADLFDIIGTTYGVGDGSTTFNVPDLQGRTIVGVGSGSGLSARALGDTFGAETHTLTTAEIPSHTHVDTGHAHTEVTATAFAGFTGGPPPVPSAIPGVGVTGLASATLTNTGGDGAHNIIQPSAALNYIIRG